MVRQRSTGATEDVKKSQSHEEDTLLRQSTRKGNPMVRAIGGKGLDLLCADSTSATEASSSSRSKSPAQSSDQHLDNHNLNTAVPQVAPVAPPPLKRKRRIKYVKPGKTALNARNQSTRLMPTHASSLVVSQVPSRSLHGSPNRTSSASFQELQGLHTSHDSRTNSCTLTQPTEKITSQDHFLPDLDPHMSGII